MAWAVSFEPPPVMIFARPDATLLPTSTSLSFSASVSVEVSPVVPVTTMPSAPDVITASISRSVASQSTSPSAVIGVTRATRTWPKGLAGCVIGTRLARGGWIACVRDEAIPRAGAAREPLPFGGAGPFRADLGCSGVAGNLEVDLRHEELRDLRHGLPIDLSAADDPSVAAREGDRLLER